MVAVSGKGPQRANRSGGGTYLLGRMLSRKKKSRLVQKDWQNHGGRLKLNQKGVEAMGIVSAKKKEPDNEKTRKSAEKDRAISESSPQRQRKTPPGPESDRYRAKNYEGRKA